jgi:large subunit ribosomal protein L10
MTTPSPAKPGQLAPIDIIINKGPTPFVPGPIISELSDLGIKTKVEGGKLAVTEDVVIVKEGEEIKENQASIMSRLGMTPMKTGLNLIAAYESGKIFTAKELTIDLDDYRDKISSAYLSAYNLAFNTQIEVIEVINALLMTAHNNARNLAFNTSIITKDNSSELLILANSKAHALVNKIKWEVK